MHFNDIFQFSLINHKILRLNSEQTIAAAIPTFKDSELFIDKG